MQEQFNFGTISMDADPRVIELARKLSIGVYAAIGIVESLRLWAAAYVPKRNIGKYPDETIALSLDYPESAAGRLIDALCEVGWVRRDYEARLQLVGWSWKRGNKRTRRRDRIRQAGGDVSPKLRLEIYERDGYMCRKCESRFDLTIDHIIQVSADGKTERSNLQTLCRPCNSSKRDSMEARIG